MGEWDLAEGLHGRLEARDADVHPVPEVLELLGAPCYFVLVMDVRKLHELVKIAVIRHAEVRGGKRVCDDTRLRGTDLEEGRASNQRRHLSTLAFHDFAKVLVGRRKRVEDLFACRTAALKRLFYQSPQALPDIRHR